MVFARTSALLGLVLFAAGTLALAPSSGCKHHGTGGSAGSGGSGGAVPCETPNKCYDTATCYKPGASRSFINDVVPIFESSCVNDFSCHGNGQQPFLGPQSGMLGPGDAMTIYVGLVGKPANETTSENFVEPGKAEASFLMHKTDQDLKCAAIGCKPNALGCGKPMPNNGTFLPANKRDVIRDWINQGAMNN